MAHGHTAAAATSLQGHAGFALSPGALTVSIASDAISMK